MDLVIKNLLTQNFSREINGVETEEEVSFLDFMKPNILDSIKKLVNQKPIQKCKTVYYPGIATDILFPLIVTDCDLLIGADLVDPSFFPILKCSDEKKIGNEFRNKVEAFSTLDTLARNLSLLSELDSEFSTTPFLHIETVHLGNGKIRVLTQFEFLKRKRTVIIYIGYDANNFIPKELVGKFLLYQSAFTLDKRVIEKLKPVYILSPEGETGIDGKCVKKETILPLLDKLHIDDFIPGLDDRNRVVKAFILSKLLFRITYELCVY